MVTGGGSPLGPFALAKGMGWAQVAKRCEAISQKLGINWFMPTEILKKVISKFNQRRNAHGVF